MQQGICSGNPATVVPCVQGDDIIELYLTKVCNSIILNGSVCHAFDYNSATEMAFFKGQPPTDQIDYTLVACVMPHVSLWVLTAGQLLTGRICCLLHQPG